MWLPASAAAVRTAARAEAERAVLAQLASRPVLVLSHESPRETDESRRRFQSPFASTFQPPPLGGILLDNFSSHRPSQQQKEHRFSEIAPHVPADVVVISRNLKEACSVASRTGDTQGLRSLVALGTPTFWCLSYGGWLLNHCHGQVPMFGPTEGAVAAEQQMRQACDRHALLGLVGRMDSLLALSEMEIAGVHIASSDVIRTAATAARDKAVGAEASLRKFLVPAWENHSVRWSAPSDVRDVLLGKRVDESQASVPPPDPLRTVTSLALVGFCSPRVMKRLIRGSSLMPFQAAELEPNGDAVRFFQSLIVGQETVPRAAAKKAVSSAKKLFGDVIVVEDTAGAVAWTLIDREGGPPTTVLPESCPRSIKALAKALDSPDTLLISRFTLLEASAVSKASFRGKLARSSPVFQVLKAAAKQRGFTEPARDLSLAGEIQHFSKPFTAALAGCGVSEENGFAVALNAAAWAAGAQKQSNVWAVVGETLPGLLSETDPTHQRARAALDAGQGAKTELWEDALPDFARAMRRFRVATRSSSAVFDSEGFLSTAHDDRCIRGELVPWGAATGRLSSRSPNIQNIDTSEAVRKLIVPRDSDATYVEADYSQLEVNVLALLSGDTRMCQDLCDGVDFHCKRATALTSMTYEEMFRKCKIEHDEGALAVRRLAKQFSFQRQYGAGVASIAASTGMDVSAVQKLADAEEAQYPETVKFVDWCLREMQKRENRHSAGFVTWLPTGQGLVVPGQKGRPSPTAARNFPVQGFAAHIVQVMVGKVYRRLVREGLIGDRVFLTNTVHDCVWVEAGEARAPVVSEILREEMQRVPEMLSDICPGMPCEVPFPVSVSAGSSLADMKPVH